MVNSDWKKEWPKKEGWYWIFGILWDRDSTEYELVKVTRTVNGLYYNTTTDYIFETENHNILWCKAELPTPPYCDYGDLKMRTLIIFYERQGLTNRTLVEIRGEEIITLATGIDEVYDYFSEQDIDIAGVATGDIKMYTCPSGTGTVLLVKESK